MGLRLGGIPHGSQPIASSGERLLNLNQPSSTRRPASPSGWRLTIQSGNRGVAKKVLTRSSTFTFTGFAAAAYSVPMGTAASLAWTVSAPDAFRIYNLLTRPQGGTAWTAAGSVAGAGK